MNQTSFKLPYRDVAAVCLLATSNLAVAADDTAYVVTPYRPTVSTPANLSTPGWLELETGLQSLGNPDSSRRDSLPYSVKLALTPDWGVRIGGELLVRAPADFGARAAGFGDTSLVIKRRFALDDSSDQARRLERLVAWRCRRMALPYGDQGLLISRALYDQVGGFRPLPLMEDVDLVRRLGRARLRGLEVAAVTSAEKWRRDGWRRRSARNLACLSLWYLGVPPKVIAKVY